MEQFFVENSDLILKLALAMVLGMVIGAERTFVHKEAGMKTYSLVTIGATVFVLVSEFLAQKYAGVGNFNSAQIASNIIVGIGFLGAGSIILNGSRLTGLTTASGLWVTAGIGMAVGFGFFSLAVITTIAVLIVFVVMNIFENPLRKISNNNEEQ